MPFYRIEVTTFHDYYLEDLKTNTYYDNLLNRLTSNYPNSPYTKQYQNEITSDKYSVQDHKESSNKWLIYVILFICVISVILNIVLFSKLQNKKKNLKTDLRSSLTKQEQNILQLLLEDKSNKEIADALFVSLSTVKTHVNNVFRKLKVQNREEIKNLFNS